MNTFLNFEPSSLAPRNVGFYFSQKIHTNANQPIENCEIDGDANGLQASIIDGEVWIKGTPIAEGNFPFTLIVWYADKVSSINY